MDVFLPQSTSAIRLQNGWRVWMETGCQEERNHVERNGPADADICLRFLKSNNGYLLVACKLTFDGKLFNGELCVCAEQSCKVLSACGVVPAKFLLEKYSSVAFCHPP